MLNLKYDIGLNDDGFPCIDLGRNFVGNPEDKFAVFELTRYILANMSPNIQNEPLRNEILHCLNTLDNLSEFVGKLLLEIMVKNGEMSKMVNENTTITLENKIELDDFLKNNIKKGLLIHDVKIFNVDQGIVFKLKENDETYSYFDGELILND